MRTLPDLVQAIGRSDRPLAFQAPGGAPGPGYHLTEVRLAHRQVLDCGGARTDETRAELQLMAGFGRPMTAARFSAIADRALAEMPGLADASLVAEVPTDDGQLALVLPDAVRTGGDTVTVVLAAGAAACRARDRAETPAGCCGPATARCG